MEPFELFDQVQVSLLHRPSPVKSDLFRLLDAMPQSLLAEVQDFAEFLQQRHGPTPHTSSAAQ